MMRSAVDGPVDQSPVDEGARGIVHEAESVRRSGEPREAHDLVLAATAVATRRTIVTTDVGARFGQLPGISCQVVG